MDTTGKSANLGPTEAAQRSAAASGSGGAAVSAGAVAAAPQARVIGHAQVHGSHNLYHKRGFLRRED